VHAEQLAIRAGQVRCGKCHRVFDALEHLKSDSRITRASPADQERVDASDVAPVAQLPLNSEVEETRDLESEVPPYTVLPSNAEEATAALAEEEEAVPEAVEPATALPEGPEEEVSYGASAFDFGPKAAADATQRARRWPWLVAALFLISILLLQATYHFRTALIVLFPEIRPYAAEFCARLGCELPLPRRIEQISIDASDLQADTANTNIMVLTATLKNRAVFEQQYPSLELTLTDAQDRPVVRRVLTPEDYLGAAVATQAGFAATSEVAVKVFIESSQVKATGYRLYLFYP
jgi:hypothetical protein